MEICIVNNCDEPRKTKGLCLYHYHRKRYKGDTPPHPSKRTKVIRICEVFDCNNEAQALSLCQKHCRAFHRWKQKNENAKVGEYVIKESLRKKRPPIGTFL